MPTPRELGTVLLYLALMLIPALIFLWAAEGIGESALSIFGLIFFFGMVVYSYFVSRALGMSN